MSSVGQGLGGIVGGVIGFMVGGPSGALYGAQVGMMVGGLLDPPKVEGPRLEDLSQQTSTYGVFIPRAYGAVALHGNVFWIQGDSLIERGVESGGKGGPEVTNYEYYASFAISLCEGPIDGVRRIWIGGQLWYDAGSDDLGTIISSNESAAKFKLYTGTETQEADPLIQADRGAANVPAYRGLAYIVFSELPLKDVGNSIAGAQVKVEVVTSGTVADSIIPLGSASTNLGPYAAASYGFHVYVVNNNAATLQIYNIADPYNPVLAGSVSTLGNPLDIVVDGGYAYVVSGVGTTLQIFNIMNPNSPFSTGSVNVSGNGHSYIAVSGDRAWITDQTNSLLLSFDVRDKMAPSLIGSVSTDVSPRSLKYSDGYVYLVNYTSNTMQVFSVSTNTPYLVGSLALSGNPIGIAVKNNIAYVTAYIGNTLQLVDISDPMNPLALGSVATPLQPISVAVNGDYAYTVNYNNNSLYVFDVSDTAAPSLAAFTATGSTPAYVVVSGSIVSVVNRTIDTLELYIFNNNKLTPGTISLGDIVKAESIKSELLTASDLDVADLTSQVRGYRVGTLGPLRGSLDPLRKAWPFDVVQHGYQIKFKTRGGASVATITEAELDAREAGASPGVQVTNIREMDTVLPDQLTTKYLDAAREYDINVAEQTR